MVFYILLPYRKRLLRRFVSPSFAFAAKSYSRRGENPSAKRKAKPRPVAGGGHVNPRGGFCGLFELQAPVPVCKIDMQEMRSLIKGIVNIVVEPQRDAAVGRSVDKVVVVLLQRLAVELYAGEIVRVAVGDGEAFAGIQHVVCGAFKRTRNSKMAGLSEGVEGA